jgi:Trehalose and maltose hydrolases (possible phosphorylases)
MIGADVFTVDPWSIPERELHLDLLGQTESIFALSNGHIGCAATSKRASRPLRLARS